MNPAEAVWKFILGGLLVLLVSWLSKSRHSEVAGLAVLFPVVTMVGYYFMAVSEHAEGMQHVVLYSIIGLPAVLVFLVVCYFALNRLPVLPALFCGVVAWLAAAGLAAYIYQHLS